MALDGGLWPVIKANLKDWHFQRIETGGVGNGVPDLNGCYIGNDIWIELKWTDGWKPIIRSEQVAWAERRARAGGRVFLAVRRKCDAGPRRIVADELWVYRADGFRRVSLTGLKDNPPVLLCTGGPREWNWSAIHELFMS